jgi:hypothetical protein
VSYDVYLYATEKTPCPHCGNQVTKKREEVFHRNYTSNTACMWDKAGAPLRDWDGRTARDVAPMLESAILDMTTHPAKYDVMNPANGWGSREGAIGFLAAILRACGEHPDAVMEISR